MRGMTWRATSGRPWSAERVVANVIRMMVCVIEEAIASLPEDGGHFSLILFAPLGTELDLGLVATLASTFQVRRRPGVRLAPLQRLGARLT